MTTEREELAKLHEETARFCREWKEGMPWQFKRLPEYEWVKESVSDTPTFADRYFYRFAPEPKTVPWEFDDIAVPLAVIRKEDGAKLAVLAAYNNGYVAISTFGALTNAKLHEKFTQLDGSPCGKVAQ